MPESRRIAAPLDIGAVDQATYRTPTFTPNHAPHPTMHLLKEYAWLLGDFALMAWVLVELWSVRPSKKGPAKEDKDADGSS